MRTVLRLLPFAVVYAGSLATASETCDSLRSGAQTAESALRDCLRSGGSCAREFERRDSLVDAAAACVDVAPTPVRSVVADTSSSIAIHVEAAPGAERDAALEAARAALPHKNILDAGTVRAAREFLDSPSFDGAKLRRDLGADQLLVLELQAQGDMRFVAFRVVTESDTETPKPRFAEATAATLSAEISRVVAELFPNTVAAAAAPPEPAVTPAGVPSPSPTPIVHVRPSPFPTSTPTPLPRTPSLWSKLDADVDALAANKRLDPDQWAPLSSQAELGIVTTIGHRDSMLRATANVTYSFGSETAEGVPVNSRTWAVSLGPRLMLPKVSRWAQPYVEVGPTWMSVVNRADLASGSQTVSGSALGFWGGAGVRVPLGPAHAVVGARYSSATMRLNDRTVDAGGLHLAAAVGVTLGRAP